MKENGDDTREYFKALGAHISVLRQMHGITPEMLAETLKVEPQLVREMETGDQPVSVPMLAKLSLAFSVPVEELMGLSKSLKGSKKFAWHAARVKKLKPSQQRFVFKVVDLLLSSGEDPLLPMMFPVHSETSAADLASAADDEDAASAA